MFWRVISLLIASLALAASSPEPPLKPESAYLSSTQYLNRYFGLALTIPKGLTPIPLPQIQGVTRWLMALQAGSRPYAVTLVITAAPPPKKDDVVSALRADLNQTFLDIGKPSQIVIGGQKFWKATAPPKADKDGSNIIDYGTIVRDYLLMIRIETDRGVVPEAFTAAVENAVFLPPGEIDAKRTSDMAEYAGPALPELGQPTAAMAKLARGHVVGRDYRNDELGLDFTLPDGLHAQPPEILTREIEAGEIAFWMDKTASEQERRMAETCTLPLMLADDASATSAGHTRAAVMLTAIDPLCLQGARFPSATAGSAELGLFAQALAVHLHVRRPGASMRGRLYRVQGHLFVNLSGTFYETEPGTGLKIPNNMRLIATQLNGYVVVWTFVAPDAATLDRISAAAVHFYASGDHKSSTEY